MTSIIKIKTSLDDYNNIVMIHKGAEGTCHLAHSFVYNGHDGSSNLLFLYKDNLPEMEFLAAWNYLDDTSYTTVIVSEPSHEQGIDDFLACWCPEKTIADLEFYAIKGFDEIQTNLKDLEKDTIKCFAILKSK